MATPQPPLTPDERLAIEQKARYERITRNVAIGGVILCPVIALLPPRKLDLYTFSLAVGFYLSADHLAQARNGRPLVQQLSWPTATGLPTEKAEINSRIIKEKAEAERARREGVEALKNGGGEGEKGTTSMLGRLWMGGETEGWKERRMEEERRAIAEGKTFTDMIFEQIWDVWNWDIKKDGKGADAARDAGEGKKKE